MLKRFSLTDKFINNPGGIENNFDPPCKTAQVRSMMEVDHSNSSKEEVLEADDGTKMYKKEVNIYLSYLNNRFQLVQQQKGYTGINLYSFFVYIIILSKM